MKNFRLLFSILTFAGLIPSVASAQVVYTDITPDSVIHEFSPFPPINPSITNYGSEIYDLDVNNDGIIDFRFLINGSDFDYSSPFDFLEASVDVDSCSCDTRNEVVFDSINHQMVEVAPLSFGDQIFDPILQGQNYPFAHFDSIYNFSSLFLFKYQLAGYHFDYSSGTSMNLGPWYHVSNNKYVGLKFYVNNAAYFGWVRISIYLMSGNPYFTIHEYAYEASGGSITAGAGSSFTGIKENAEADISVSPNPSRDEFVVTTAAGKTETLTVFDSFGKLILQDQLNNGKKLIESKSWAPGMYLLRFTDGEKTFTKKLIKTE
jgi:hypothetical protein